MDNPENGRAVDNGSGVVHFDVRGKVFTTRLDELENFPDSYLSWIVQNNYEAVQEGRPIPINRKPESFKHLLAKYRHGTSQPPFPPPDSEARHREVLSPTYKSEILPDSSNFTSSHFFHSPPNGTTMHHSNHNQNYHHQHSSGLPRSPPPPPPKPPMYSNVSKPSHASSTSTTSSHKTNYVNAPRCTEEVVGDAVHDIVSMLERYNHGHHQLYDKALIVLSWGRKGEGGRVLRPQLSKLYDSMSGRAHDVRRSSDGSGSFEGQGVGTGWGEFDSVYSATSLSARVQAQIVEKLRKIGYASCFTEVKLDRNGVVDWRGSRRDLYPRNRFESASVRCLVVNLN